MAKKYLFNLCIFCCIMLVSSIEFGESSEDVCPRLGSCLARCLYSTKLSQDGQGGALGVLERGLNERLRKKEGYSSLLVEKRIRRRNRKGKGKGKGGKDKSCPKSFNKAILKEHNNYRKKHGAKPLKLNTKLNKIAQKYAGSLGSSNRFEHDKRNKGTGENLYRAFGSSGCNAKEIVDSWYNEGKKYSSYGKEPSEMLSTGHFTQLVWKGTKEIGVGFSKGIVVVRYKPQGNMAGKYAKNVLNKNGK